MYIRPPLPPAEASFSLPQQPLHPNFDILLLPTYSDKTSSLTFRYATVKSQRTLYLNHKGPSLVEASFHSVSITCLIQTLTKSLLRTYLSSISLFTLRYAAVECQRTIYLQRSFPGGSLILLCFDKLMIQKLTNCCYQLSWTTHPLRL